MSETTTLIKKQRLGRGWTLVDLQRHLESEGVTVSESQLSKIERGKNKPYPPLRAALSRVLGLDIDLQKVEVDA